MRPFTLPLDAPTLTDGNTPADVIDALFLQPFLDGTHPFARSHTLENVGREATLRPAGAEQVRRAILDHRDATLFHGEGWTLLVSRWRGGSTVLTVTGVDQAVCARVLDEVAAGATEPPAPEERAAELGFWSRTARGPVRRPKRITVRPWDEIRRNYTGGVAAAFEQLAALSASDIDGRLLLFHGPPGTGKTTALRALAFAWREWCTFEYMLDPEQLLRDPGYLVEASTGDDEGGWRLLVLEDCDELIRADAKSGAGQSLARLLNLTDGILGQGLDVLVAITTNEPLTRLHPAIVRPGRCLAQVEVGRLSAAEARAWLGAQVPLPAGGLTLAELYARLGGSSPIEADPGPGTLAGYL